MKYYKMVNPGGKWTEITEEALIKVINSHFEENKQVSWDGSKKPSRTQVIEHVKSGKVLHLYTANYKAEVMK